MTHSPKSGFLWRLKKNRPWIFSAVLLLVLPWIFKSSLSLTLLTQMCIAIIICLSYNILLGQGGMLNFGHAVYVGIGAYLTVHIINYVSQGWSFPIVLIPVLSGLGSLTLALFFGWISTKKSGTTFAMITFGIGEMIWAISLMLPEIFGGEGGISANRSLMNPMSQFLLNSNLKTYYFIATYTLICTALIYFFTLTPLGQILKAVRDNSQRAEFIGYDSRFVRYLSFLISAFFAGVAGSLSAINLEMVTSDSLSAHRSGMYLIFTFIGGVGFFYGPILGGVTMILALVLLSSITQAWFLYVGLFFVFMVMYVPGGIASLVQQFIFIFKTGILRRHWKFYGATVFFLFVAFIGTGALIEMVYQFQIRSSLGSKLKYLFWTVDIKNNLHWYFSILGGVLGWLGIYICIQTVSLQLNFKNSLNSVGLKF